MTDGRMDLQYSIGAPTGKSEGGPGVIGKGEHGAYISHELRGEPFAPRRLWLGVYTKPKEGRHLCDMEVRSQQSFCSACQRVA